MSGEIGLKIKKIQLTKFEDDNYEMCLYADDGNHLHIVGDNDLKTLLYNALNNIVDYKEKRNKLIMEVNNE